MDQQFYTDISFFEAALFSSILKTSACSWQFASHLDFLLSFGQDTDSGLDYLPLV